MSKIKAPKEKPVAPQADLSWHDHYICKKEVAKLLMASKGITFIKAFESIPDEAITSRNPKAIFEAMK